MGSALKTIVMSTPGFVVILYYLVFAIILIASFYELSPQMKLVLSSSPKTPWGVFTSIFVNDLLVQMADGLAAIAINLLALMLLIYLASSSNRRHKPKRELLIFCLCPLLSATVANMAAMPYSEPPVRGTSGLAYAMVGVVLCTSTWDLTRELDERRSGFRRSLVRELRSLDLRGKSRLAIDVAFFLAFLAYAIFSPTGVFNTREAEVVVRVIGVILGYIETWILI